MPATDQQYSTFVPLTYVVNLQRGLCAGEPWGLHLLDGGRSDWDVLLGVIISAKTFRWE